MAARSDARVLLNGESGTGKELLAAHIHESSPFSSGPFVKVNCAAIPTELIEAELFGHEKGAYTGAVNARRGKFELADGGTIFLDEVGDLHANSQAKLLRILQEGEFHRVGGEQPVRVNVRVISATNRDLTEMIREGRFREDLFYRLCVVPVRVPGLRERPGDIPALAEYFLTDFCTRNNFRAKTFNESVFETLQSYAWPGNVRELKNVVERMAILTPEQEIGPTHSSRDSQVPRVWPRQVFRAGSKGIRRAGSHPQSARCCRLERIQCRARTWSRAYQSAQAHAGAGRYSRKITLSDCARRAAWRRGRARSLRPYRPRFEYSEAGRKRREVE